MEIREAMKQCHATAVEKGWWESGDRNFGELLMLLTTEVAEAYEEYRNHHPLQVTYYSDSNDGRKPEGVPSELADILVRLFDFCEYYQIPLEEALIEKMAFNKSRSRRHGGKKA